VPFVYILPPHQLHLPLTPAPPDPQREEKQDRDAGEGGAPGGGGAEDVKERMERRREDQDTQVVCLPLEGDAIMDFPFVGQGAMPFVARLL